MSELVKAIGYCSTATREQARQNHSIETQRKKIEEAAQRLNVEIVEWFEQTGAGESRNNFGQKSAEKYCQSNPDVQYLFVAHLDRLGSSIDDFFVWNRKFRNLGVSIKMANAETLGDSVKENFLQAIQVAVKEIGFRTHSEAIKRGLRRNKELERSMVE
jgi:DNA invertase Pin-like site-specific DNA recombinase